MFSIILSINSFGRILWAMMAGKALDKFGLNKIIFFSCGLVTFSILSAAISPLMPTALVYVCLLFMMLSSSSRVLSSVASTALINHRIQSDERATVLSVKSMIDRICSCFAMLLLKPLFDTFGVSLTFLISGVLIIPIVISAFYLTRLKIQAKNS